LTSISIRVDASDQVGEARRRAATLASSLHLDPTTAGRLAIVVTECANNLWKHAPGGEIVLSPLSAGDPGVDVLALDNGPGMPDLARCLQDGYSTAGSPGTGLGAIERLATVFDVYSVPGKGTALLARIQKHALQRRALPPLEVGGVCVPMPGETECGDDFAFCGTTLMVVDGLGHGPLAADCAAAAVVAFTQAGPAAPSELLGEINGALRGTRGAAVAIAQLDLPRRELRYAAVGNIAGFLEQGDRARHLVSFPGIAGNDIRNVRELTYQLGEKVLLLLYSDGITTHWSLDSYEGLVSRDPSLIAGVVYRDHSRRRDDATVVVVRQGSSA
jgi:anti-sigma regulatory factor (Ser/Thr protein kinase)